MFKKLKDKIAEEVKQSPLKTVQQLAQAVVSPTSSSVFEPSSSNDKFCIEEGDIEEEEASAPAKSGGFTSVTLTGQTSSPLRDTKLSFRPSPSLHTVHEAENFFPVFEPQPTNFHVQSEVESASEVEDRYSQLEHINKESLYEAYRKVYNRYNRMKNKYHELVTHYRQLDREKERAKTVLTETQDKALLRISELREQCVLEQQAKAHLEEALRNELEERDHIISSLKTKVQYLKTVNENGAVDKDSAEVEDENLIDFTDNSQVTKVPSPSVASSDSDWPEEQIKKCKEFFNERSVKIEALKSQLEHLKKSDVNWNAVQKDINIDNEEFSQESNIPDSLERLLNELTEEVKTVQEITDNYIQQKSPVGSNKVQSIREETLVSSLDRTAVGSGDKTNNNVELDLGKLVNQYKEENIKNQDLLRELEKQNQDLNKRLREYTTTKELIKQKYEDLNNTCATLKSYLHTINENCSKETLTIDLVDKITSKNELSKELLKCVHNLCSSKIDLKKLKNDFEKVEKDNKDIIGKLESNKSEKEKLSNEFRVENKTLGEQLERLRKENNLLSSQQESLKIEVSDLRKEKKDVENKLQSLADLVKHSEEKYKSNQETLKQVNLKFIEEKNTLQSNLATLQSDLQKENQNNSALQQENKDLNEKLLNLKQEIDTLLEDKNSLESKIKEVQTDINQTKQENSKLLESSEKVVSEMSSKQTELLSKEKEEFSVKLNDVEQDLEKSKIDLLNVSQAKEKLLEELDVVRKELVNISAEKVTVQAKVDQLEKEIETNKQEYVLSSENLKQMTHHLNMLSQQHQELTAENHKATKIIKDLNRELELEKSQNLSASGNNDKLLQDFKALEKRKNELDDTINAQLTKIGKLEEEKININKQLAEEIESKKGLLSEFVLEKETLLSQICSLKGELNEKEKAMLSTCKREDEVKEENSKLIENIKKLTEELQKKEEEFKTKMSEIIKTHEELSSEKFENIKNLKEELQKKEEEFKTTMSEMMKTHEELSSEKYDLEKNIDELKLNLKSKVEEVHSLNAINEQTNRELISLKSTKDKDLKDNIDIKSKYDMLLAEFDGMKQDHNSISESKMKLNEELTLIKQEYKNTLSVLDGMKNELQNQQKLCSELNQSLNELTDSFQLKSDEIEAKSLENSQLKNNLTSMMEKYNQTNDLLQKLTTEKSVVLENLLLKFNDIKYLKKVQQNLLEFVGQFKKEIFEELNSIKTVTEKELLCQTKHILEENEASNRHLVDIEIKTKEEINAFNSKLQNLEADLLKANDKLKDKKCHQCELNMASVKQTSTHLYTDKHNLDSSHYQLLCKDLQTNLNQAVKFLRMLKENLVSKQPVQLMNGITHPSLKEEVDLELKESWSSEKTYSEIDLFLKTCETISLETNVSNLVSKPKSTEYLIDNIPFEPPCDTLILSKMDASNKDTSSKVQQLLQELNLKNEMITELQKNIEEINQEKNLLQSKNHKSSEETTEQNKNYESRNERLAVLEQENHALMQKVLELQETYDLKIQNIISDYENKLEERTLFDLEVTSKEKKNIITELKEQVQNLQQDLDDRGDAFEKLYEEHHQTLKQREEESRQVRVNYEKEMREQDKKWRSCLDRRVAEEEIRHQAEVNELTSEWTKQRKELETASRLAVSVVESGSSSSEMLRRQVQALTVQLNELEANRCELCDTKRAFSRERRKSNGSSRSIQDCTEMEYLRNILYEYMMGKEPLVLAKVLCALVKFDDTQTNDIVVKEQQKITLLGQLGLQ